MDSFRIPLTRTFYGCEHPTIDPVNRQRVILVWYFGSQEAKSVLITLSNDKHLLEKYVKPHALAGRQISWRSGIVAV